MDDRSTPSNMLVLVGEQRIPNAIPTQQINGIANVEMIYSTFTAAAAHDLRMWLEGRRIAVVELPTEDVNDYSVQRELVRRTLLKYGRGRVLVNLTGGTKIMSLSAAEAAKEFNCPTVYVDTQGMTFRWVHPNPRSDPLSVTFTPEDFFLLHGQPWDAAAPPTDAEQIVSCELAQNIQRLHPLLKNLQSRTNKEVFKQRNRYEAAFLDKCASAKLVTAKPNGRWKLLRPGFFRQNLWLECFIFAACRKAGADDVQWRVQVKGAETDVDVAATFGPSMLICSCKSGKFKNSHIDELSSHARLVGGTFCRKALIIKEAISFERRGEKNAVRQAREKLEERASALQVKVFYWDDYKGLTERLGRFMRSLSQA